MSDWIKEKQDDWRQSGEGGINRWIGKKEKKSKELENADNKYGIGSTSME
jgi:heat shock protein HslJ